jgi:hypothetical protein
MKTTIQNVIALTVTLLVTNSAIQAQSWQWAHSGGGSINVPPDQGLGVVAGSNDTIYAFGIFNVELQLDSHYNVGNKSSYFIAQYTPSGQPVKSALIKRANSNPGGATAFNFNTDKDHNLYVSGDISNTYTFDTLEVTGGGGYVAKFNSKVKVEWVKFLADINYAVSGDNQKNIYSVGSVIDNVGYIDTFALHNPGGTLKPKMYLAKLDSTGKCQWVKQSYGTGAHTGFRDIKVSGNNVYASGFMVDSCASFDNNSYCINAGFLMNTDTNGSLQWLSHLSRLSGGASFSSIGTDASSNCYTAGGFDGTIVVGNDTIYKQSGVRVALLMKYNPAGTILWKRQIYGDSVIFVNSSHTDISGNTYLTGTFSGTAIFGNDTVTATAGTDTFKTINRNMFITRYDANGNYLGVKTVYNATPESITTDTYGNAIVTGSIKTGTTYFDTIQRTSRGGEDYFVAKLSAITGGSSSIKTPLADNKLMIYANPNRGNFTIDVPKSIVTNTTAHLQIYSTAGSLIKDETVDISGSTISVDLGTVLKGLYTVTLSGSGFKKFTGKVMVE